MTKLSITHWSLWNFFLYVLLIGSPHLLIAQEDLDRRFLDESFQSGTQEKEEELPIANPAPLFRLSFDIEERYVHRFINNNRMMNSGNMIYTSPYLNKITVNSLLAFQNGARWLSAQLHQRVYIDLQDETSPPDKLDFIYFIGYEVIESYAGLHFWKERINLRFGKILRGNGSAFLINPSNPLSRTPGHDIWWAKNRPEESYFTDFSFTNSAAGIPVGRDLETEIGSGKSVGAWMLELEILFSYFSWKFSYLPKVELNLEELDRPFHSIFSQFILTRFPAITPSIIFFYEDATFLGLDIEASVGKEIILYLETGISLQNERPHLRETKATTVNITSPTPISYNVPNYSLRRFGGGRFIETIAGISYTPRNLFNVLFEIFYTGKGLDVNQWEEQKNHLARLYQNYVKTLNDNQTPLAAAYKGIMGKYLEGLSPLRMRPLYFMLRISRDDVLQRIWTERIDITSSLLYSPFDTTFQWRGELEWVSSRFLTLGIEWEYYFGKEGGIFTELPYEGIFGIYTKLEF